MILLDLNQVMISNIMMQIGNHTNAVIEEDLVRHMVLNTIRSLNTKYKEEYGELIIVTDDRKYWRREVFEQYKANRKKTREESDIDWSAIFNSLNKIKEELKQYFPYRVIQVERAEADDIIATLVFKYGNELNMGERILILSADKDFIQLHCYGNVKQYDPIRKKFIQHEDPVRYLREHVLKGDSGDGIPNVLSADNCIVDSIRQTKLTQKKIDELLSPDSEPTEQIKRNIARNKTLIDLNSIPLPIRKNIEEEYEKQSGKDRSKLFNYFVHHRLKNLMENINEF